MNITSVNNLTDIAGYAANGIQSTEQAEKNNGFESLFQSALKMVQETNDLTNAAEEEEMKFAMGLSDNYHDLRIAQGKATASLQYTAAVKNAIVEAYKEIMNMQF